MPQVTILAVAIGEYALRYALRLYFHLPGDKAWAAWVRIAVRGGMLPLFKYLWCVLTIGIT